jgi:hypothetical protein
MLHFAEGAAYAIGVLGRVDEIFARGCFWDSSAESGMIHRSPTESEAGAHVDEDER